MVTVFSLIFRIKFPRSEVEYIELSRAMNQKKYIPCPNLKGLFYLSLI